jgi:hypothetical protein
MYSTFENQCISLTRDILMRTMSIAYKTASTLKAYMRNSQKSVT